MNKLKITALLVLTCLVGVSCEDILDDNVNPDKPHSISVTEALPVVVFYAQQINYDHAEYYNCEK